MSIAGGVFFLSFIRDIFGKGAGLIAAVFVAINPWHFIQSRWALDCNLYPIFYGRIVFFKQGSDKKAQIYFYINDIFRSLYVLLWNNYLHYSRIFCLPYVFIIL